MSIPAMMKRMADGPPLSTARLAGFFWLMTALTGTLALVAKGGLATGVNLVATACYAAATVFVYLLLKPVSRGFSLLAAVFSLMGCAVSILGDFLPLPVARIPTLFFGLHCFLVGCLILGSTYLPRFVGALMVLAGVGWLTQGLTGLLSPPLARALSPYPMAAGILGELTLTFWLLVAGVNVGRWQEQAGAAPPSGARSAGTT